ncbi:Pectinesterase, catalytic [Corchorus olitorius]|uniref:Pectinesterase n=1 Tax=Corchorus olitorius TaxID=93759 RepID=A0A1R3IV15_9ROSI|nr:Pectinesterase, catalytic [Corchorus olitorius]
MTKLGSGIQHVDIVSALINKTILEHKLPTSYFTKFSSNLEIQQAQHVDSMTGYCQELLSMSLKRLKQSLVSLQNSQNTNKQDVQTWISAALTYQQACKDSVDDRSFLNSDIMEQISRKMDYLSQLGSNTLALVNKMTDQTTASRKLAEDNNVFPTWVSAKDRKLLQAPTVKANAVVAKDGTGNYETISEAIKAASGGRFVIYVKAGVYKEKIRTNKDGITLIGDGKYNTIIVGDDSVRGGSSMPGSATFTVTGDGFIARDIGFQNTAGPQGEQALALNVASDHSVFYRCSMAGYQDTIYAFSLRQFYRECDIYGTIDFIFGNAAAVFQSCTLSLRRPRQGSYNVILANGRSDPGQNTGFAIQNCRIVPSSEFSAAKHSVASYLGRPWKQYSRAIVFESTIDDAIAARGWVEWPGAGAYSKSLYFAEYANAGPGAGTSKRVTWPGFHVIGRDEAVKFTVDRFIGGTSWLPSTGVTFISGLQ